MFWVDLRHEGELPRDLSSVLELMGWAPLRPGQAYLLDWDDALETPGPTSLWDRIDSVLKMARTCGLGHTILTLRRGEKVPVPLP